MLSRLREHCSGNFKMGGRGRENRLLRHDSTVVVLGTGILNFARSPQHKINVCNNSLSFSFPLAEYTKSFITSVVIGNDIVPR